MKDFITVCIVAILILFLSTFFGNTIQELRSNTEISTSSSLFKEIVEIKRNCSEDVSYIIREVLADDKLTYREYNYIILEYEKENDKKILEELKK